MHKVSVVIPTHNRAALVRAAISSVLDQTFQDFEILVVDDASDDDTEAAVRAIQDSRIQYFRHAVGRGDAGARNTGVRNAKGQYVAFLDDDDEWLPEKLRVQVQFCEESGPDVAAVPTARWTISTKTGEKYVSRLDPPLPRDLQSNWITTSTILLRRSCFDSLGLFDERIPFCSDYDMWIRISRRFRFGYIAEPLVNYHVHGDGLSGNLDVVIRGMEMLLAKHGDFFAKNRITNSRRHLSLGTFYCYSGDVKRARAAFLQATRLNPLSVANYFNLCLSLLGAANFKRVRTLRTRLDPSV